MESTGSRRVMANSPVLKRLPKAENPPATDLQPCFPRAPYGFQAHAPSCGSCSLREKALRGLKIMVKSLQPRLLQGKQLAKSGTERSAPVHARMFRLAYCPADALDPIFRKARYRW